MKAPVPRHERRTAQSMFWAVCLLCVLVSAMSLGSMRLYGLYLEHRLAYVITKIDTVRNRNAGLEEHYSSLLSPARIYNYARVELGMTTAREVEIVRLSGISGGAGDGMVASLAEPVREIRETRQNVRAPGLSGVFLQAAHAKD